MNLAQVLEFAALRYPPAIAIVGGERRNSYAEWDAN